MRAFWAWAALTMTMSHLSASVAEAAVRPKVVVVLATQAAPASLAAQELQALERELQNGASLVPLADYLRAAKALGIKPLASLGDEAAVPTGKVVGATHVLFLRPQASKRREPSVLSVVLVDVATGETSLEQRISLTRRNLSQVASKLSVAVIGACEAAGAAPAPAFVAPPVAVAQKSVPPAAAAASPSAAPQGLQSAPLRHGGRNAESAAAPEAPELVLPPVAGADNTAAASAVVRGPTWWQDENRSPLGIEAHLGALLFARVAQLNQQGIAQLRYGAAQGSRSPLFARGTADLEFSPSRWKRHNLRFYDGFLLFARGEVGAAKTRTETAAIRSLINGNLRLGAGFRAPLWHGEKAIAASLRLGYSRYSFASTSGVPFVGVGFSGMLLQANLEVPLGMRRLALVGGAGVVVGVKSFGGAKLLGGGQAGFGALADVGLRLSLGHIDVIGEFAWERYAATYSGRSQVPNFSQQYNNVGLVDLSVGGRLRVGVHF